MALLSSPTLDRLRKEVRIGLRQQQADNSSWSDEELGLYINDGIRNYFLEIQERSEGQFDAQVDLTITANSELIPLPTDCFEVKVVYIFSNDYMFVLPYRNNLTESYVTTPVNTLALYRPYYYFRQNSLVLRPIPGFTLATTIATLTTQGVTITAVPSGTPGNAISLQFIDGATAGNEIVSVVGQAIIAQIQSGVSTVSQVVSALQHSSAAATLIVATGSGASAVSVAGPIPLAGGTNGGLRLEYTQFPETLIWGGDIMHNAISPIFRELIVTYAMYKAKVNEDLVTGTNVSGPIREHLAYVETKFRETVGQRSKYPQFIMPFNP